MYNWEREEIEKCTPTHILIPITHTVYGYTHTVHIHTYSRACERFLEKLCITRHTDSTVAIYIPFECDQERSLIVAWEAIR